MTANNKSIVLLAATVVIALMTAGCGRAGGAAARSIVARAEAGAAQLAMRDAVRDRATRIAVLQSERKVFRYTTREVAKREVLAGFRTGTHFTSKAGPGRPVSGAIAAGRYGLQRTPGRRVTVRLPKGTGVRFNKTLGGRRGVGEITIAEPLPPSAIERSVRLPRAR